MNELDAKIGQATRQVMTALAETQANGLGDEDFMFCVDVTNFYEQACKGCKWYEVCELLKEDNHGQST